MSPRTPEQDAQIDRFAARMRELEQDHPDHRLISEVHLGPGLEAPRWTVWHSVAMRIVRAWVLERVYDGLTFDEIVSLLRSSKQ